MKIIKLSDIKNGEELTEIFLKSDVLLLTFVFEKSIKVSVNEFGINPLYCVSLPAYTWQCGLKYTKITLQTLQDKDITLLLKNNNAAVFQLSWVIDLDNQMKIKR